MCFDYFPLTFYTVAVAYTQKCSDYVRHSKQIAVPHIHTLLYIWTVSGNNKNTLVHTKFCVLCLFIFCSSKRTEKNVLHWKYHILELPPPLPPQNDIMRRFSCRSTRFRCHFVVIAISLSFFVAVLFVNYNVHAVVIQFTRAWQNENEQNSKWVNFNLSTFNSLVYFSPYRLNFT